MEAGSNAHGGDLFSVALNRTGVRATCIDCNKGIAHTLPGIEQHIGAPRLDAAGLPAAASAASK